jgi:glutamyl-tRNA reductase
MKLINLIRPKSFASLDGQAKIVETMMLNAYRQGLIAGESKAYRKVIDLLHAQEVQFLSILDRTAARRPDLTEKVRSLAMERFGPEENTLEGGIKESKE